jgi:ferredoxin
VVVKTFKVHVDEDLCIGAGQCVLAAPQIFDQDDRGLVILLDATPPAELHEAARKAAKLCPARAITIEESIP